MSLSFDILGIPGRDNALLVRIDTGQSVERLLFDCGDGCLNSIPFAEILAIDQLFFSHLHMDHVAGFDYFFRAVFSRENKPNRIWGPPDTGKILHHRMQGFLWNLHAGMTGTWKVTDVTPQGTSTTRFELAEAFAVAHDEGREVIREPLVDRPGYVVEAHTMNHRTPSIAYIVREKPRSNFEMSRLAQMGLSPGPWMKHVRDPLDPAEAVVINGTSYAVRSLRESLIVETPGDSIAYLTDFILDEDAIPNMAAVLKGCQTIVCEGQYRHSDLELARKHFHMTTRLSGQLAREADAGQLILFHLSDRYSEREWLDMLEEAREQFPQTSFPAGWKLDVQR